MVPLPRRQFIPDYPNFHILTVNGYTPRLPSENGGIQAAQYQISRKPFYYRFFNFPLFTPRLPSENGGVQAAQYQISRKPFYYRLFNFPLFTPRLPSENGGFRPHNTQYHANLFTTDSSISRYSLPVYLRKTGGFRPHNTQYRKICIYPNPVNILLTPRMGKCCDDYSPAFSMKRFHPGLSCQTCGTDITGV